jgi:murein DD-endopeptidase
MRYLANTIRFLLRNRLTPALVFLTCLVCLPTLFAQSGGFGNAFLDVQIHPAPVIAWIEGQPDLVYELHITNFRPATLTLTRLDVLQGSTLLHTYEGMDLASSLTRVGASAGATDPQRLDGGQRAVFYSWLPLPDREAPLAIRHRISFRLDEGNEESVETGEVGITRSTPVMLSPPLRGGPWVAVYDPGLKNGHRRVIFAIDGNARIPARFAVDWIKLGSNGRFTHDDPSKVSNSYSYGEDVLAVADGIVVGMENKLPEPTPNISIKNEAGNYIALDLGQGRFAFYEHLKPGSIRVKLNERVRAGQILGSVGASGSVFSGAHLHFHVADANAPLAAEGLPFVFRSYQRLGSYPSIEALERPWTPAVGKKPITRSGDMPAPRTIVSFD